jgi:hypothetical protein
VERTVRYGLGDISLIGQIAQRYQLMDIVLDASDVMSRFNVRE